MRSMGDFILLFLLEAVLGKLMDDSGPAQSIARRSLGKLGAKTPCSPSRCPARD